MVLSYWSQILQQQDSKYFKRFQDFKTFSSLSPIKKKLL